MSAGPLLEVRDLSTYFYTRDGVVKAVDGVSYAVNRGETIALVGESGCGKTVSALSVMRLVADPPGRTVSGGVLFDGTDLLRIPKKEMRDVRGARIAMVFQEALSSLNPLLTVGHQIAEALQRHRRMSRRAALDEAISLLKLVGIPQPERRTGDYPHQFSGGMRQRAMIAMAVSCRPQLIMADEPTTVVDVTIQTQLLELIRGLTEELGTALVLITHNLGIVARYARRVYVMYAGRMVESGPAPDIYHRPAHPYTAGLLASVPRLDEPRKTRLIPIEGQPPDLVQPPAGCAFQPRCAYASADCPASCPTMVEVSPGHYSACWRAGKTERPWLKT